MKSSKSASRKQTANKGPRDTGNSTDSREQICDICAQDVPGPEREKIFAFGKCDHFVCYVCSARLRVICDQSDCPICREKLETVIFSSNKSKSYERYNLKECLYSEKYKIYFENKSIKDSFDRLLRYDCLECLRVNKSRAKAQQKNSKDESSNARLTPDSARSKQQRNESPSNIDTQELDKSKNSKDDKKPKCDSGGAIEALLQDAQGLLGPKEVINKNAFTDVFGLRNHLNYVHKLKLCDLCLTHNKLFPFEYSYYDLTALKKHMKEGEPKTSHRGHPNCTLCHNTFFNTDELIQHMSREHFHCHLCGRHDSNMRIYFQDYNSLRDHFKSKHFLCERDRCRYEQFTSAFDNRIDYQLHIVQVHGNQNSNLSRGEARQQRTITLESAPHRARQASPDRFSRQNLPPNAAIVSTGSVATANNPRQQRPESLQNQLRQQRLPTRAEFPALGQLSASNFPPSLGGQVSRPNISSEQFPNLSQNPRSTQISSTVSQRMIAGPSSSRGSFVRSVGGGLSQAPERFDELEFPPLPEQPKPKVPKKKAKAQTTTTRQRESEMTLDQLISSSLRLSSRSGGANGKLGSKKNSAKPGKSAKPKPIKIQIN